MITKLHWGKFDFIFQYHKSTKQPFSYHILCPLKWKKHGATFYYFKDCLTAVKLLSRSNSDFHSDNLNKIHVKRPSNHSFTAWDQHFFCALSKHQAPRVIMELNKLWLRGGGQVHQLLGWPHLTELKKKEFFRWLYSLRGL